MVKRLKGYADKDLFNLIQSKASRDDDAFISVLKRWLEKCRTDYELNTDSDADFAMMFFYDKKIEKLAEKAGYDFFGVMHNIWEKIQMQKTLDLNNHSAENKLLDNENKALKKELEELKQKSLQELGQSEIIRKNSELQQALNAERAKTAELEQKLKTGGKKMNEELTQWEYKTVKTPFITDDETQKILNDSGKEGWEAVNMQNLSNTVSAVLLKRPKQKGPDYGYSR